MRIMTRTATRRTLLTGAALTVAGVLIAGCNSQNSSSSAAGSASTTVSTTVTSAAAAPPSASAATGQPASAPATPTASIVRVPMQTAAGGEFQSPTGNITCEVDQSKVYCQTGTPARSVTMDATGKYTTCTGQQCLGNAGENTPILAYGTETGVGQFLCQSAVTGVTCTTDDNGFQIAIAGITSVPG